MDEGTIEEMSTSVAFTHVIIIVNLTKFSFNFYSIRENTVHYSHFRCLNFLKI